MGIIMGLDISKSSTGCAIIDENMDVLFCGRLVNKGIDDITLIRKRLIDYIRRKITEFNVTDVVIEDVFGGINFETNRLLIILNECAVDLRLQNPELNYDIFKYENTKWKAGVLNRSGKDIKIAGRHKEAVQEALGELYDINYLIEIKAPSDMFDALGIAVHHYFEVKEKGTVVTTVDKNQYIRNFRLGLISFYFLSEGEFQYILEHLSLDVEHRVVEYDRSIQRTTKMFYKEFMKTTLCCIHIDSFTDLGLDLMKFNIADEVKGWEDFYCIAVVKQIERTQTIFKEFKDRRKVV